MIDKCLLEFDQDCEKYASANGGVWLTNDEIRSGKKLGIGNKFLLNLYRKKYCEVIPSRECRKVCSAFDSSDPDSPISCYYAGNCEYNCKEIDPNDPLAKFISDLPPAMVSNDIITPENKPVMSAMSSNIVSKNDSNMCVWLLLLLIVVGLAILYKKYRKN
jgi:hypothetical protein